MTTQKKHIRSIQASLVKPKAIEWLIPNRWPIGFAGYIDGETTVGKSTVLCAEIAALTTGAHPVNAGIVNLEDPIDQVIVPRLLAAGADLNRAHILEVGEKDDEISRIELPRDIPALEQWAKDKELRFIVIDPAISYLEKGISWLDEQDMRKVMDPLALMARNRNLFVAFVRHWLKGTASKALTQGSGSGTIANASRIGFACIEDPEDSTLRYFAMVKSNLCALQPSRMYRIEETAVPGTNEQGKSCTIPTTKVKWLGESKKTANELHSESILNPERKAIKDAIVKEGKPLLPSKIAEIIGKNVEATRQLCLAMFKDKQLDKPKHGYYWPKGVPLPSQN